MGGGPVDGADGSDDPADAGKRRTDGGADDAETNDGQRFDRLPATAAERTVPGRATRAAVLDWWDERFGIPPDTFEGYSFWERGAGKLWALRGSEPTPAAVEGLGITFLRTRQEHWKPTLSAVQRFGRRATRNVIHLTREEATAFLAGRDQALDWDGDWGYLVVAHELAGSPEPLGVGLYVHGELRSQVPKGRQREL
jgi:NOL1/NOP2/fmu family ribosome biogenesis protein